MITFAAMPFETTTNPRQKMLRLGLVLAFLATLAVFVMRGPIASLRTGDDFVLVYGPARVWLQGGNPYRMAEVDAAWTEAGLPDDLRPASIEDLALLYPPTTLVMLAPFATMPWTEAHVAWVIANVVFLAATLLILTRLAGWRVGENRWWVFMIAALLFAPVHTSFRTGQTPLYVMALLAVAYGLTAFRQTADVRSRSSEIASGVLLACAALIKPQIGLPFIALELLRRRWVTVAAVAATCAVIAVVAIVPLSNAGHPWLTDWQVNLNHFTNGNVGNPTVLNPARHQLLNLHYPLHSLIESRGVVNVLTLVIVGGIAAWFFRFWILDFGFWMTGRTKQSATAATSIVNRQSSIVNLHILPFSMISVLTLMVAYHRFYDAVLLLLPLAWAIGEISRRRNIGLAWGVLLLMVPYFLNAAKVLKVMETRAPLPSWILDQWWWNALVMPQQAWALLGMAILMIGAGHKSEDRSQRSEVSH